MTLTEWNFRNQYMPANAMAWRVQCQHCDWERVAFPRWAPDVSEMASHGFAHFRRKDLPMAKHATSRRQVRAISFQVGWMPSMKGCDAEWRSAGVFTDYLSCP